MTSTTDTAGHPDALSITTDHGSLRPDGKSLAYLTVHVNDAHGVQVPDADNPIHVSVTGAGSFAGADNGKEDDAEGYKSTTHDAFNGLMLAIVQAADHPGPIHVTVTSPGLRGAEITLGGNRQIQLPRSPAASSATATSRPGWNGTFQVRCSFPELPFGLS